MRKTHTARVQRLRAPPVPTGSPLPPSIRQLITALANEEVQRHLSAVANEPVTNTHMQSGSAEGSLPSSVTRIRA